MSTGTDFKIKRAVDPVRRENEGEMNTAEGGREKSHLRSDRDTFVKH